MKKLILIALSVFMIVSLVGCGKKTASADCRIVVAKSSEELDAGTALSAEDAASLTAQIAAAEAESQWIGAVSDSIASCCLSIETERDNALSVQRFRRSGRYDPYALPDAGRCAARSNKRTSFQAQGD